MGKNDKKKGLIRALEDAFGAEGVEGVEPRTPEQRRVLLEGIEKALKSLTPREERVIRMRFGINKRDDQPLEEVGQDHDVTRERVRQIEAKALRKLRRPGRSVSLRRLSG